MKKKITKAKVERDEPMNQPLDGQEPLMDDEKSMK